MVGISIPKFDALGQPYYIHILNVVVMYKHVIFKTLIPYNSTTNPLSLHWTLNL